jgi:DNA-binding response OmpR family regulator
MQNSKDTILVIEDEEALGEGLCFNLQHEGFDTVWMQDGRSGLEEIKKNYGKYSAILLDLMLPYMDGFQVLKATRELAQKVPICILSAKGGEADKVEALELGADDYVTKPFILSELMLRVKGLVKRSKWYQTDHSTTWVSFGQAQFSFEQLIVESKNAVRSRISPTEGLLIQALIKQPNVVLNRSQLLSSVWHYDAKMETRTVDVFVGKLRKLIEENPAKPQFLISVRGVGYIYVTDPSLRARLNSEK